jgi:Domain of unknown function (DUF4383)
MRSRRRRWRPTAAALTVGGALVGVVYLVVRVLGLFILNSSANILALNGYDNWLHLFSGAALVGFGSLERETVAAHHPVADRVPVG